MKKLFLVLFLAGILLCSATAAKASISVDIKANGSDGLVITSGTSAILSWTSDGAEYCLASGNWSGEKDVYGSETTLNLSSVKIFTITCINEMESASDSVIVNTTSDLTVDIKINGSDGPITISNTNNTSNVLSWTSVGASSCRAAGDSSACRNSNGAWSWEGVKVPYGSETAGLFSVGTHKCGLICTGLDGSTKEDMVTIVVNEDAKAPTLSFKLYGTEIPYIKPSEITSTTGYIPYRSSYTLNWSSTSANYCTASTSGNWSTTWVGSKDLNGYEKINLPSANPTTTSKYFKMDLSCSGSGGSKSASLTAVSCSSRICTSGNIKTETCVSGVTLDGDKIVDAKVGDYYTPLTDSNIGDRLKIKNIYCNNTTGAVDIVTEPTGCLPNWSCDAWSACVNNKQTRNCIDAMACGIYSDEPETERSCVTPSCTSKWECDEWSSCLNNQKTRTCADLNSCETPTDKPAETQVCASNVQLNASGVGGIINFRPGYNDRSSSMRIPYNTAVTLSWTSDGNATCTATGDWSGSKPAIGSETTANLTSSKTYALTCGTSSTSDNKVKDTVKVSVEDTYPNLSYIYMRANHYDNSTTVSYNSSFTLTYGAPKDVKACYISSTAVGGGGARTFIASGLTGSQVVGSMVINNATSSKDYTFACNYEGSTKTYSKVVTVNIEKPTLTVTATSSNGYKDGNVWWIPYNSSATINWTTSGQITSCAASGNWSGSKSFSGSESTGPLNTFPTYIKTYNLTCAGPGGSVSGGVGIRVLNP